jgi:endo-1,4-beta-xylanase
MPNINLISLVAFSLLVSACGGGGGSKSVTPPPVSSTPSSVASSVASSVTSSVASSVASSSATSSVASSVASSVISSISTSSSAVSSSSVASSSSLSSVASSSSVSSAISSSSVSSSSSSIYSAGVDSLKDLEFFPIGAAVTNNDGPSFNILTNASEQAVVEKHFNQMTAGNIMKVSYMHPSLNTFSFTNADNFVNYAKENNMTVHGHALIWHADYQVPAFMKNWSGTSEDFLTMLDTHVTTIVDHFEDGGTVVSWDVVNEALNDNSPSNFRTDSAFWTKSGNSAVYIERAFQAARLAHPTIDLYYNDYNIDQNNAKTTALINMLTDFQDRDIPITGVGFQMHVFMDYPSITNIKAAMQKVADKGLKVKITELDVSINNPYSGGWPGNKITTLTETQTLAQKKRYCEIVKAYLDAVPVDQRGGITVWGTTDANTWLNSLHFNNEAISWPLLFDSNYNDKPALRGFADALTGAACTNL